MRKEGWIRPDAKRVNRGDLRRIERVETLGDWPAARRTLPTGPIIRVHPVCCTAHSRDKPAGGGSAWRVWVRRAGVLTGVEENSVSEGNRGHVALSGFEKGFLQALIVP